MRQTPIMIVSDAPDQQSGLARVARDLATLISSTPEFRVATLGWGGLGCQRLPWQQYQMQYAEFGERSLPAAWQDFSEGQRGIVLTIYDLHRILWLARPEYVEDQGLREWVQAKRQSGDLVLWAYVPIDATGPMGKLTGMAHDCLLGCSRLLTYTPFGLQQVFNTIGAGEAVKRDAQWMPHSVDTRVYTIQQTSEAASIKRIGCVMTNQQRKDWGTWTAVARGLVDKLGDGVKLWAHVDQLERDKCWSLQALVADFGLEKHVEITLPPMADKEMAERYRACDLTILPSSEGYGFPIFESLACGVPCLHGDYAGGASLMRAFGLEQLLVPVQSWRLEGVHNALRPVFDPADWLSASLKLLEEPLDKEWLRSRVSHLDMKLLGHRWKAWLREGIADAK